MSKYVCVCVWTKSSSQQESMYVCEFRAALQNAK